MTYDISLQEGIDMNQSANQTALSRISELITEAAEKRNIKKAVFSKSEDASVLKAVVTLRETSKKIFLQAGYQGNPN